MIRLLILCYFLLIYSQKTITQDFMPLWPGDNIPNSRGINVEEVIVDERILQVYIHSFHQKKKIQEVL